MSPKNSSQAEQPQGRSTTIHEIARYAHVSTASVSRALNGESGVGKETARQIREVAAKLGYYPSSSARTLVTGRSRTFGLLVSDIVNPFFAELLREFEEEAVRRQYEVIVANINNDPRRIEQSTRRLLERKVDGVAVMTAEQSRLTAELRRRRIPMVFLEGDGASKHVSNIAIDALSGIQQALKHLRELGHSKIGYLGAPLSLAPSRSRMQAFEEAAKTYRLKIDPAFVSTENSPNMEGGMSGMSNILMKPSRPTGVLVFNDAMALGAIRAARRLHVAVPGELSIIGFDDVEIAAYSEPELTTIRFSRSELAGFAFNTLFRMSRSSVPGETTLLGTSLVVRSSTAPVSEQAIEFRRSTKRASFSA